MQNATGTKPHPLTPDFWLADVPAVQAVHPVGRDAEKAGGGKGHSASGVATVNKRTSDEDGEEEEEEEEDCTLVGAFSQIKWSICTLFLLSKSEQKRIKDHNISLFVFNC